jgi:hypothetical protein
VLPFVSRASFVSVTSYDQPPKRLGVSDPTQDVCAAIPCSRLKSSLHDDGVAALHGGHSRAHRSGVDPDTVDDSHV